MTYSIPGPPRCLGLIVISYFLTGCSAASGPPLAQVKGTVTVGDKPLSNATIMFLPENGPMAIGQTDDSGNYTLKTSDRAGVVLGMSKVCVTKVNGAGPQTDLFPEDMKTMAMAGKKPVRVSEIASKYSNPTTSGLEAVVTGDASKDVFDFKLTE